MQTSTAMSKSTIKSSDLAKIPSPDIHILQPLESIHRNIASKIVNLLVDNGFTIFGSYVREYICDRPFNPDVSDIDVFSATHSIQDIMGLLTSNGFRYSPLVRRSSNYGLGSETNGATQLYGFTAGLENDMFFTGRTLDVSIDFVCRDPKHISNTCSQPPFYSLDFMCNAWIWDSTGIRLSRHTGTSTDHLSPRDIKYAEINILEECKNFITRYYPMDKAGDPRSLDDVTKRIKRLERVVKMLFSGWSIENTNLVKIPATDVEPHDICTVCQDTITGDCLKLQCCTAKYHRMCFIRYGVSELDTRTYIRCAQRCTDLDL